MTAVEWGPSSLVIVGARDPSHGTLNLDTFQLDLLRRDGMPYPLRQRLELVGRAELAAVIDALQSIHEQTEPF